MNVLEWLFIQGEMDCKTCTYYIKGELCPHYEDDGDSCVNHTTTKQEDSCS